MSLEPITVLKTLNERLDEYSCIFSGKPVSVSEVKEVWSNVLELTLRNNEGWQALWKIPRTTCGNLNIVYPTVVFVEVNELNYEEHSALVTIVAVEDDIELPEQHEALLIHLHPTIQQQISSIVVSDIAHCLDNLRFFYNHIWQPWDDDDDKNEDWVTNRLEPRMKLFQDMQAGLIGPLTVAHTRHLLQEAKNLYKQKIITEEKLHNDEGNDDDSLKKCLALEEMELQYQLDLVKHKIEMVENPFLRVKAIEHHLQEQKTKLVPDSEQFFIVWHGGKYNELMDIMNEVYSVISENSHVRPCDLKTALEQVDTDGAVFLCRGIHKINNEVIITRNGTIRGFPSYSDVVLTLEEPGPSLFDWGGTVLKLRDLTLSGQVVQALLTIRCGVVELRNCQLTGDPRNVASGAFVMPGAMIELIDCQLSGFDSGIIVKTKATLNLVHCSISSCGVGIQIYEGAEIELIDSQVLNCSDYGVILRTNEDNIQNSVGSLQLLDSYASITVQGTIMEGNCRGDVLISPEAPSSLLDIYGCKLDVNMESEESPSPTVNCKRCIDFTDSSNTSLTMES